MKAETPLGIAEQVKTEWRPDGRLLDGITFAEDIGHVGEALCGKDGQVLWQKGEPLMLYGPQGVGKTTVAQRMMLTRAGVEPVLFGLPVMVSERPTLYVAADRPAQAARSWRRMVASLSEDQRALVRERVLFWRGPLPFDIGSEPDKLLAFALELGIGTFIGDSLKDLAMDLSKEEPASRVNRAWQLLISNDIEVFDLHHPRKSVAGQIRKPRDLDEVYGNTWLTAGHGSIVLLWGKPGDPIVELSHLKQPLEEVGPFRILVDHEFGMVERYDGGDLPAILRAARSGLAAKDAACVLFSTSKPSDSEVEKARRRLEKLVDRGLAIPRRGGRGERGRVQPTTYLPAAPEGLQEELYEGMLDDTPEVEEEPPPEEELAADPSSELDVETEGIPEMVVEAGTATSEPADPRPPDPQPFASVALRVAVGRERASGRDEEAICDLLDSTYTSHIEDGGYPEDWKPPEGYERWTPENLRWALEEGPGP